MKEDSDDFVAAPAAEKYRKAVIPISEHTEENYKTHSDFGSTSGVSPQGNQIWFQHSDTDPSGV